MENKCKIKIKSRLLFFFNRAAGQKIPVAFTLALIALGFFTLLLSCRVYHPAETRYPRPPIGEGPEVLVRLSSGEAELAPSSRYGGVWRGNGDGRTALFSDAGEIDVVLDEDGVINIKGETIEGDIFYFEPFDDLFQLNGNNYRGTLKLKVEADGLLTVFEKVHMEDYIRGVLPAEIYPAWPMDAIIAQAVAIRTFALSMVNDTSTRSWLSQLDLAYRGADAETKRTDEAVRRSAGTIMTFEERLFPAFFHSTCGRHTASAESVFGSHDIMPLQKVECGWCEHSRHSDWTASFTLSEISEKIFSGEEKVESIEPAEIDSSRRAEYVVINGTKRMRSSDFRLAMGSIRLKSTRFSVSIIDDKAHFIGSGFGHGVGLCQWGSQGMAEGGKNWEEILAHYYPGTKVETLAPSERGF